jgi:8-oxo-dGTP diphosphatase
MRNKIHVGVYAVIVSDGQIVLIKKARGPYQGLWDLPGGSIEEGESPEQALIREVAEETGLDLSKVSVRSFHLKTTVYTASDGMEEKLWHFGALYEAECQGKQPLSEQGDGLDSLGAGWFSLKELRAEALSPIAAEVIQQL